MLKLSIDRYKTQKMCDKAVNDFLTALKFAPDWFVTIKMIKILGDPFFNNYHLLFSDEDSCHVTLSSDKIGILRVGLINIIS